MSEITREVQEVIDYVLKHEPEINFKICSNCGRNLPAHDWFYSEQKGGKYGYNSKCKKCISILRKNGTYKFESNIREEYFKNIEKDFKIKFRYMSIEQLQKEFKLNFNEVKILIKRFKLRMKDIINSLTDDEIIFMYKSLLNNEIKVFTNGIYNNDKYILVLIKYMINNILKWNRNNICENFSIKTFKENGLGGLLGLKKFKLFDYLNRSFPELNIMPWELRSSTTSWTEENINIALKWFKNKLLEDKDIDNINYAGTFGFKNLLDEYNLMGLQSVKFKDSYASIFKAMYRENFSKEEMLKYNYTFKINTQCVPMILKDKIYKLTEEYNKLNDRGKTLVNEVIKFCEIEKRFPGEKDLSNINGYICRTQFYKYFKENNLKQLYKYIIPVYDFSEEIDVDVFKNIIDGQYYNAIYIKPNKIKCIKCGEVKEFIEDNFYKNEAQKFGLKYICKDCELKIAHEQNLNEFCKKNNISLNEKYNIFLWYDTYLQNNLRYMPEFCYEEYNIIKIIKYVITNKLTLIAKEQICDLNLLGQKQFEEYRIDMSIYKLGGKLSTLQKCFPKLNIVEKDIHKDIYTEDEMNNIIKTWINNNNLSILNLLSKGITYTYDNKMSAMMAIRFHNQGKSRIDMIIWYCKRNNILHPIYNRPIIKWDFEEMPTRFWSVKENRIERIKYYCEYECKENILSYIYNTDKLKEWTYNYFKSENVSKLIFNYAQFGSLYDLLVETYPEIKENFLLFEWEWHQYNKNNEKSLIKMLREFIIYRLSDIIEKPILDIPKYINYAFFKVYYPKFIQQINKKRFSSFYEWCCNSFPEYRNYWIPEDFGMTTARDGIILNSLSEKTVYEHIKYYLKFKYLKAIGTTRSGKYIFILPEDHEDNKYCPDFVIEYLDINNKKVKLNKNIYIEYYGMYNEYHINKIFINYKEKTKRKNQFYKNNSDIYFIDFYPDDLKNQCEGIKTKLENMISFIINYEKIVA